MRGISLAYWNERNNQALGTNIKPFLFFIFKDIESGKVKCKVTMENQIRNRKKPFYNCCIIEHRMIIEFTIVPLGMHQGEGMQ